MKKLIALCLAAVCMLVCLSASCAQAAGEDGKKTLTIYWAGDADIATSDVWIWPSGGDGKGYLFSECEYGFVCRASFDADVTEAGFIVRTGCSDPGGSAWGNAVKDFADDRFVELSGAETEIWLKTGDGAVYNSTDGGKTLEEIRKFKMAGMIAADQIRYVIAPAARIEDLSAIHVRQDGREIGIKKLSSLGNKVVLGVITTEEPMDVTKRYTVEIEGYGSKDVLPTEIFDSADFVENYTYDGDDLGAVISGDETTFKVWAPTASEVVLNLFEAGNGCDAYAREKMTYTDHGVWSLTMPCGHGTYYTYTVTTSAGTQEAVDPYARTLGVNGDRGMVTDLSKTDPEGFDADTWYTGAETYQQASVWEVHVRDFSSALSGSRWPGKYLAFTETGLTNAAGESTGIDYVKQLGVTHVHLQPVYDYATVDETDPESGYNWGYDPKNYNAPEGSYSTDPYNGEVRVREFKQMVAAIHDAGMGVVMDVVYNHTYDINSNLNKIVPYYYYRFTATGDSSNGSGCGNETASERKMFRKYMKDSVTYWMTEYHIDGFRFDLMALHDRDTMQQIEQVLHEINPSCLIYGEGWTGGTSALNPNLLSTQANISKVKASEGAAGGVAVFNDAIRDGLKGSVFDPKDRGWINGKANTGNARKVIFGIEGGETSGIVSWKVKNAGVINYMSCHDNLTLYDKLKASCPDASDEEIVKMQRLGAAAVFLAKGTPFTLAGEEMMRTKQGDENSYKSSDEINKIDWEALVPGSDAFEMSRYYAMLNGLRKEYGFLTNAEVKGEVLNGNAIGVTWTVNGETAAYAVLNPAGNPLTLSLPAEGMSAAAGNGTVNGGACTVQAMDWALFVK